MNSVAGYKCVYSIYIYYVFGEEDYNGEHVGFRVNSSGLGKQTT